MSVNPIAGTTQSTPNTAARTVGGNYDNLGATDFMTLLLTQLKNQDPLDPQDQTQFLSQLAQLQSVSELKTMNGYLELSSAMSMLGRDVLASIPSTTGDGESQAIIGTVATVLPSSDGPLVIIRLAGSDTEVQVKASEVQTISARQ